MFGPGGISIGSLLLILLIVVLLFGTKKLRNMGGDLGSALKNFKDAVKHPEDEKDQPEALAAESAKDDDSIIEAQVETVEEPSKQHKS